MTYLLSLYTFSQPIYPQLIELVANCGTEAAHMRDRLLSERRTALRVYAMRCKEASKRKEILGQIAYLHVNVERI